MPLSDEDQRVIFEIAFAIEDPCCFDAIVLARELLLFARRVAPKNRQAVAGFLAKTTVGEDYAQGNNVRNETDELSKMQS